MDNEMSITYMSGPLDGKTLHFEQPEPGEELVITIGRREGCDIQLPFDSQASRLHARLVISAEMVTSSESVPDPFVLSFWLDDMQSRNGTFLEREQIRGRVSVRPGMLFRIGRTWLRVDEPITI
jgi:pSer/pThr/pTyr-binding forkhead associated (FHA) protein